LEGLSQASNGVLKVVHGDILEVDEGKLLREENLDPASSKVAMVGNLPFNVSTELMLKWLYLIEKKRGPFLYGTVPMVLLFQEEVADRIAAKTGHSTFTRLSIMVQRLCKAQSVFKIEGASFVPPPKVNAKVVLLEPLEQPLGCKVSINALEFVCRQLFGFKRKMISNAIRGLGPDAAHLIEQCSLNPNKRPQELTIEEWCRLAAAFEQWAAANSVNVKPLDRAKFLEG